MEVLYLTRRKLNVCVAPTLQIVHTVRSLCATGTSVRLVTPWPRRSVQRVFRAIVEEGLPPELEIESIGSGPDAPVLGRLWPGTAWKGIRARFRRLVADFDCRGRDVVAFTRDRNVAAQVLAGASLPMVFEYHEPRSVTMAEDDDLPPEHPKIQCIRADELAAVQAADALVTVSQAHADEAPELYRTTTPVWCIPNGADPRIFSLSPDEYEPVPGQMLYVGSLKPWKGLPLALAALRQLTEGEARLHVCGGKLGSRDWKTTIGLIDGMSLADRVVMHGHVPQRDLRDLLRSSMLGILPLNADYALAERYTSPLKLFEYITAGLPVVAGDVPSVRQVLGRTDAGLTFAANDAGDFADKLRQILDSPATQRRLSVNARHAAPEFSWQHRGRRIAEVCHDVLAHRNRSTNRAA